MRLLAEKVLDPQHVGDREVPVIALELLRQRRPADPAAAVDVGDVSQLVRLSRLTQLRGELRCHEDEAADRGSLGRLENEEAAQAVADRDGRRAQAVERRDDVLDVHVERQLRRVGRPRPMMVLEVERVALPAARREVPEIPLPEPRPGELAVDEQQRLAARPPFGQPRLDVQAPVVELDLVLADRPAVRGRDLGAGKDLIRGRFGHRRHLAAGDIGSLTIRGG